MKEADPGVVDDLKAADREAGDTEGGGGDEYVPSKDTASGKDLPEGVELEPEDEEVV